MAFKNKKNFAISELASSMNDSQTSATVKAGEGVKFPSTNFWFIVDVEIMLCSSRTDDVLTVTRGQQSTSAAAHNTAARCYNSPTIACVEDLEAAFPASAVNENVVVFDGITGEKIKDSLVTKANLEDAITKKHIQGTDQKLDDGGVNEVTVANAKDAVDKKHTSGSETLGGDGAGTVSNATINKIKGKEIDEGAIADDKILVYKTATSTYVFEAKPEGVSYAQYVTVAKSGGDYTTITAALNSISDAATDKRYCILVYMGDYDEAVTCKSWVDIIGLNRRACRIKRTSTPCLTSANDCMVKGLGIISTHASQTGNITLSNAADTFIIRDCYIERIANLANILHMVRGASTSGMYLKAYDSEFYCENTGTDGWSGSYALEYIRKIVLERCDVTAKGAPSFSFQGKTLGFKGVSAETSYIRNCVLTIIGGGATSTSFYGYNTVNVYKVYSTEFVCSGSAARSIHLRNGQNIQLKNCHILGNIELADGSTQTLLDDAQYIKNTPSGHVTATDVQAAINELASLHTGNRGLIYVSTSGTMTITTGNTFEKIIGGTIAYTAAELSNFTHAAGVLTYTGTPTLIFIVTCFISIESGEIAQEIHVRLAKNGADIAGSCMQRDFTAQNRHSVVGFTWILSLATNDTVEAQITSDSDSDDIIINHLSFVVRGQ